MIVLAVTVALSVAIGLPHALRLEQAPTVAAATIWLSGLLLRALATVAAIIYAVASIPGTQLFQAATHWCWEAVLPLITTTFRLDGHSLGDAAVLLPAAGLLISLTSVALGLVKAAHAVGRLVRAGIGVGPTDSVIIGDGSIVVAAAGLRRPRVIVSAGALAALEDEELYAGIAHEHGHIRRGHRWLLVLGELARALGRCVPGAGRALSELSFHLERDADAYALRQAHQPADLASAICKAALTGQRSTPALAALAGTGTTRRVRQLLKRERPARSRHAAQLLAVAMSSTVLLTAAALPAAAATAASQQQPSARHCLDD